MIITLVQFPGWDERTYRRQTAFEELHDSLVASYYVCQAPQSKICAACGIWEEEIVLCRDCGPLGLVSIEVITRSIYYD